MKFKLITDFHDYYDHYFDLIGEPFYRKSRSGMNRIEMFKFLEDNDILTVYNGYPKNIISSLGIFCNREFIIYTDLDAHRAEGKIKVRAKEALEKYSENYCSEYIDYNPGVSYRHLQIGDIKCWLKFQSNDWRSNYGNVDIEVISVDKNLYCNKDKNELNKYPLYAIDYVKDHNGDLLAVDFNIAPQIKGTGIEDIIPAKEIVEQIKSNMERSYHGK